MGYALFLTFVTALYAVYMIKTSREVLPEAQQFTARQAEIRGGIFWFLALIVIAAWIAVGIGVM